MGNDNTTPRVSVIIPTFNGSRKIGRCLDALRLQDFANPFEIIVVIDGSTDDTIEVLSAYPEVRVFTQNNSGPAVARNKGARLAEGDIILFTDDDCEPAANWLTEMVKPFADADVVGAKGTYRTRQKALVARFVQIEYESRYALMRRERQIDFIDTYSAAFRKSQFLQIGGYDVTFPVACAEDVELSYRMASKRWLMVFAPGAVVYHQHPDTLKSYLKKKFKFAYWRMLAVKKNPAKALKDSHTPQIMKLQLLLLPASVFAILVDLVRPFSIPATALVLGAFAASSLGFIVRASRKDWTVGMLSIGILALRSVAQFWGVTLGFFHARSAALAPAGTNS